jgi:hypothetical protein
MTADDAISFIKEHGVVLVSAQGPVALSLHTDNETDGRGNRSVYANQENYE